MPQIEYKGVFSETILPQKTVSWDTSTVHTDLHHRKSDIYDIPTRGKANE